ncbi:MAG: shikimate dehydrogenase [Alphaproteobacteria bacterium]
MLSGAAKLAGVVGWPVKHSLSPSLHGFWLTEHGIDGAYLPLAVTPEDLVRGLRTLPRLGFVGVNVTVPHKEAAIETLDVVEKRARRIGAVNTLVFEEGGRLRGDNTDAFGFLENLREQAPGWEAGQGPAVVLGAGGAARAVCAALVELGSPEIRLLNRNLARAETVATQIGGPIVVRPWSARHAALAEAALVVNATSLGMVGCPLLELNLAALPRAAVVYDIVYTPMTTTLLEQAAARGHTIVDGLGMLLHQARPGFAAWFGIEPRVTPALRAFVAQRLTGSSG